MSLSARPNNNGNTVQHFTEAFYALTAAQRALDEAHAALVENVLNGRNYQHLDSPDGAMKEDRLFLSDLKAAHDNLEDMKVSIVGAIQPENRQ